MLSKGFLLRLLNFIWNFVCFMVYKDLFFLYLVLDFGVNFVDDYVIYCRIEYWNMYNCEFLFFLYNGRWGC